MSALAELNVVPFKASPRVTEQMRRLRQEDAYLAALLLMDEPLDPALIGRPVEDFLMQIRWIKRPRVEGWLRRARVSNPRMPVDQLYRDERTRLAALAYQYSQERPS